MSYFLTDTCPSETPYNGPMGIQYSVVDDLATEPVTLEFFKSHNIIDYVFDDTILGVYLKAAREYLEEYCQKSFGAKTINVKALYLPDNYRLMYGKIEGVVGETDYELLGDILKTGGEDIDFNYTTIGVLNDVIKIAICRYAAGLYALRENILSDDKGNPISGQGIVDQAKLMCQPYRNIVI